MLNFYKLYTQLWVQIIFNLRKQSKEHFYITNSKWDLVKKCIYKREAVDFFLFLENEK